MAHAKTVLCASVLMSSALAVAFGSLSTAQAQPDDSKIEAAHAAQNATASSLAEIELELTRLNGESSNLAAQVADATAQFITAQSAFEVALGEAEIAQERSNAAQDDLDHARKDMGDVAKAMYQNKAGSISDNYAIFGAQSLYEATTRDRAYDALAASTDAKVRRFVALKEVAQTLSKTAKNKAEDQAKAAADAQKAADRVVAAQNKVEQQKAEADKRREELAVQLATQKGTTVELERQRLEELEKARIAASQAAADAVISRAQVIATSGTAENAKASLRQAKIGAQAAQAAAQTAQQNADKLAAEAASASGALVSVKQQAAKEAQAYAQKKQQEAQQANARQVAAEQAEKQAQQAAERARQQREAEARAAEERARKIAQQQAEAKKQAASKPAAQPQPNPVTSSSRGQDVVNYARQFVGVPYVWGGSSTSGWDCSGYVQFVYKKFGVNLPHQSEAIYSMLKSKAVPASQGRPGDILWWPGHVAIYTGNGKNIAAHNPSIGTDERAIWGNPVYLRVF